ncbi:MAG: acylneuraminate cytidylyltransferase family protein [Acidobacteria bacterium]|nr:acylneuraminate cytidylyltransferase family protein [Acidobacteriota bacterium]
MSLVLGLVPARAGSKGVPGKNTRLLAGRPLLAYTADAARASGVIDRLVLSTDDPAIAEVGRGLNIETPFLRPAELAADDSPMFPVIVHALSALEAGGWIPDIVVLLQPTSPLRRPDHIVHAVRTLVDVGADSVVSVVELPRHLSPDYVMRLEQGLLVSFLPDGVRVTRRQDARAAYVRDGTVYACWRKTVLEQGSLYGRLSHPLILPASESLSIDTIDDWHEAERRIGTSCS